MSYIIVGLIAYLLGSISFSIIFTQKFAHVDVRTKGSGNAGSTNVLRVAGKKAAAMLQPVSPRRTSFLQDSVNNYYTREKEQKTRRTLLRVRPVNEILI